MGFLHEGHLSLVREAMSRSDACVVSIYVNPTQFAANEDFGTYPRDEQGDLAKLRSSGVHAVFVPKRFYATGGDGDGDGADEANAAHETFVVAERLQMGLCSTTRPHFFRGVATVVTKLFNVVEPDVAVFGKKDYQQWRVVRRLVRDLDFAVDVVGAKVAREPDGVALSSRNVRLTPENRKNAVVLSASLFELRRKHARGDLDSEDKLARAVGTIREAVEKAGGVVEYVETRRRDSLAPLAKLAADVDGVCLIAAKFGDVRLLDNVELGKEDAA
jgi:pantoate--beta-alanine ligase